MLTRLRCDPADIFRFQSNRKMCVVVPHLLRRGLLRSPVLSPEANGHDAALSLSMTIQT